VETLKNIGETITLRFYYSQKSATGFPQITSYARRVEDMLDALAGHAQGKLRIEIIKPEPFSPDEDRTIQAGITAIPTNTGDPIYFGIEGSNKADGHEVIPYLAADRENLLEYDLVSLIDRLNRLERPVLGIMGSLPLATGPGGAMAALQGKSQPYRIYQDLEAKYKIEFLGDSARIPADTNVLMLAHPTGLSAQTLYAIDQFVLSGGHVLAFIDPLSELTMTAAQGQPSGEAGSNLGSLLPAWGLSMPAHEVVGDRSLAQRVMIDEATRRVVGFIPWLALTAAEINREDPVTAQITQLSLNTAGHLEPVKGAGTTITPLLNSSEDSMIVADSQLLAPDPVGLLNDFRPSGVRYLLGARLTGTAKTAFPNGPPPPAKPSADEAAAPPTAAPPAPQLKTSKGSINVIVIADTDLFDDTLWLQTQATLGGQEVSVPTSGNDDFVLNAVDNLSGSNALLSLRGRQIADRKFDLVEDIRRQAEERYLSREESLNRTVAETEKNLEALQHESGETAKTGGPALAQQHAEIERFRQELAKTRSALREVQRNLRRDIDDLGNWLKLINIILVPVFVAAFALGLGFLLKGKRKS
jgi:ABC-type uncharacterized transport system involved in gliding motility auxiliary subunit